MASLIPACFLLLFFVFQLLEAHPLALARRPLLRLLALQPLLALGPLHQPLVRVRVRVRVSVSVRFRIRLRVRVRVRVRFTVRVRVRVRVRFRVRVRVRARAKGP